MATDELDPRRADPTTVVDYTTLAGRQRHLRADADGVIQPKTVEDEQILIGQGFGVHADAKAKQVAARAKAKAKAKAADKQEAPKPAAPEGSSTRAG